MYFFKSKLVSLVAIILISLNAYSAHQYVTSYHTGQTLNEGCCIQVQIDIHTVTDDGTDYITASARKWIASGDNPECCEGAIEGFDDPTVTNLYNENPDLAAMIDEAINEALDGFSYSEDNLGKIEKIASSIEVESAPSSTGSMIIYFNRHFVNKIVSFNLFDNQGNYIKSYGTWMISDQALEIPTIHLKKGKYILKASSTNNKTYAQQLEIS